MSDGQTAFAQGFAHFRICRHVYIAMSVAGFYIGETFPAIGQREKGFAEYLDVFGAHRKLPSGGALQCARARCSQPRTFIQLEASPGRFGATRARRGWTSYRAEGI